ncbi:MAG: translocation/assembly module TamB [Marinilabiliales bacterium]|nr:MAG: translocation/assembly module TamB [Marinilabiliales bacterium]
MSPGKLVKYTGTVIRIILRIIISFLLLFVLITISLQFPAVQTMVGGFVTDRISSRTGTAISLDRIAVRFPGQVSLQGIFIEDARGDTLLSAGSIRANIRLPALLRNRLYIGSLRIDDLTANITRCDPDTIFNWQVLAARFGSGSGNNAAPDGEALGPGANSGSSINTTPAAEESGPGATAGRDHMTAKETPEPEAYGGEAPEPEAYGGLHLILNNVSLNNIAVRFVDQPNGTDLDARLDHFSTTLRGSDLLGGRYRTGHTLIDGGRVTLLQTGRTTTPSQPAEDQVLPEIRPGPLTVRDFIFSYSGYDGSSAVFESGALDIDPVITDLAGRTISLRSVISRNMKADIFLPGEDKPGDGETGDGETGDGETGDGTPGEGETGDGKPGSPAAKAAEQAGFSFAGVTEWIVSVSSLAVENAGFGLQTGYGGSSGKFDPGNFSLGKLDLSAGNIYIAPDSLNLDIDNLGAGISDTFSVRKMVLHASAGKSGASALLDLATTYSSAGIRLSTNLAVLDFKTDEIWDKEFSLVLEEGLAGPDLLFFYAGTLPGYVRSLAEEEVRFSGSISGTPSLFAADNFSVGVGDILGLALNGSVANIAGQGEMFIDTGRLELHAGPDRLYELLAGTELIPDTAGMPGFMLPSQIRAEGTFTGSASGFTAGAHVESDFGSLNASLSYGDEEGEKSYSATIYSSRLDAGRVTGMELFTSMPSVSIDITGRGTDPALASATATMKVSGLSIADYDYNDILIDLALEDSVAYLKTRYSDDYLNAGIEASAGLFTSVPSAGGTLAIEYADLGRLGLVEDELLISTGLEADLVLRPAGFFSGLVKLSATRLAMGEDIYTIPEITVRSVSDSLDYFVEIESDFLEARYHGNVTPAGIPSILAGHLSDYFTVPAPVLPHDMPDDASFQLNANLFPEQIVNLFLLPAIESYDTLSLSVSYDGKTREIGLQAGMKELSYGGAEFHDFSGRLVSDAGKMDFRFEAGHLGIGGADLGKLETSGTLSDDMLDMVLSVTEPAGNELFYTTVSAETYEGLFRVAFGHDKLILAGTPWSIDPLNRIVAGRQQLSVSNFNLAHGETSFSAATRIRPSDETDLLITLSGAELEALSNLTGNLLPVTAGTMNATATARNIFGETALTSSVDIRELVAGNEMIDRISILLENEIPGLYHVNASMNHRGGLLRVHGAYNQNDEMPLDISIFLDRLDLSVAEPFTAGGLTHITGLAEGKMHMTGSAGAPLFTGSIQLTDAAFRVPELNTGYFARNEIISFDRHYIRLNNLTLHDSLGRSASVNGTVNYSDPGNILFSLDLGTRNFLLMNLEGKHNDHYHGRLLVDSDLRLRGSHHNPSVEGRIKFNEGSAFTFIVPRTAPEAIGDEGVVEFMTPGAGNDFLTLAAGMAETGEITSSLERTEVSLNIELDRQAEIRVVIDDLAGDNLVLRGGGVLSFGIDQGGAVSLAGRYEINEGEYLLTFYDVIRRNFRIRPGSSIVWTGDPLGADLDITAIYNVRTGARELMRSHIPADQANAASLRQQYPFQVYLGMTGNLMNPNISFELDMPPEHRRAMDGALMARINEINRNESELNKQVFALLLLGGFIHENPLAAAGTGGGITSTARSSVSQMLSQQLNRMSDRFIRGVDISFEMESYEDFADGDGTGRTELQMEVSRNFFDERFRITVGGNIELEDEMRRRTGAGDIAGDFSLEYLLTPGGNLLVRGFRTRDYGDLVEPDLTRTGISLIFSRSYNNLMEIFRRREEEYYQPVHENGEEEGIRGGQGSTSPQYPGERDKQDQDYLPGKEQ